jgi:hypothetical protein
LFSLEIEKIQTIIENNIIILKKRINEISTNIKKIDKKTNKELNDALDECNR